MNIVVNEIDISWFTHHFSRARVLDVITSIAQWIWRSHRPSEARCKCVKIVLTISTCVKIQELCNLRELLCALSMVILVFNSLIASQVHPIQYSLCISMYFNTSSHYNNCHSSVEKTVWLAISLKICLWYATPFLEIPSQYFSCLSAIYQVLEIHAKHAHLHMGTALEAGVRGMDKQSLIARFMGPAWGPSGADRAQVGPMLAPWTLLSGTVWSAMHNIPVSRAKVLIWTYSNVCSERQIWKCFAKFCGKIVHKKVCFTKMSY